MAATVAFQGLQQTLENKATDQRDSKPTVVNTLKRKLSMEKQPSKHRKQPFSAKQPLQALYEKFGKIDFNVTAQEEENSIGFNANLIINGIEFVGSGPTKVQAKREAAKKCLTKYGIEFCNLTSATEYMKNSQVSSLSSYVNNPSVSSCTLAPEEAKLDFASDYINFSDMAYNNKSTGQSFEDANNLQKPLQIQGKILQNLQLIPSLKINFVMEKAMEFPTMVMHEIFPEINEKISWVETGLAQRFQCEVELNGQLFFGEGLGKKQAKQNLAKSVLSVVLGISNFKSTKPNVLSKDGNVTPLSRKHPFAQVKHIDPNADYKFQKVENKDGSELWHVTLRANSTIYEAMDVDKNKAKLEASKQACNIFHKTHNEDPLISKSIDTLKNPVQMLYEYYGNVDLIEDFMEDNNLFVVGVEIDGQAFTAEGSSKKMAREELAIKVFEEVNNIDPCTWESTIAKKNVNLNPSANLDKKNPVAILNELHSKIECTLEQRSGVNQQLEFVAFISFEGKVYEGIGISKKNAKADAAAKVLQDVYSMNVADMETSSNANTSMTSDIETEYSDKIVEAVYKKFGQIFPSEISYKVIASIVMAKSKNEIMTDCFEVISIGTGTKCIVGDGINNSGEVINDCHAEVIACRGMRQFFFDQIWLAMNEKESCFERMVGQPCFKLKKNLHLYLYISTAPCGDGRVYSNTKTSSSKNKSIGCLRTKIENGQGTIPVPENTMQTTDGILEGERLLTMSCSDKIMKYVVLGAQGALLSLFLQPIYFKGIIIGDQYNYDHLFRALFSRVQLLSDMPPPYHITKPEIAKTTINEGRDLSKATNNSFNWYYGQKTVEVVNGVTGKTMVAAPSRLSKRAFYKKFCNLAKAANVKKQINTYHDAKTISVEYQKMKKGLFKHLHDQGYGKWVGKPIEQDIFF